MIVKILGATIVAGSLLASMASVSFASPEGPLIQACTEGGGTWNPADHTCTYPKK